MYHMPKSAAPFVSIAVTIKTPYTQRCHNISIGMGVLGGMISCVCQGLSATWRDDWGVMYAACVCLVHSKNTYIEWQCCRIMLANTLAADSSIVVGLCLLCCTNCLLAVVVFSSSCSCPVAVMGRVTTSSKCSWGWLIDSWRNGVMTARGPILLERLWFRNSYSGRNQVGAMMGQK